MKATLQILTLALVVLCVLSMTSDRGLAESNTAQPTDFNGKKKLSLKSHEIEQQHQIVWEPADYKGVIWDNGMNYTGGVSSQVELYSTGLGSESADDFMFTVGQFVTDVHWTGVYWFDPVDGDFDWVIRFYNDDNDAPGVLMTEFYFPNAEVNETLVEDVGTGLYFSYSVNLGAAVWFYPNTKYWISIQGQQNTPPQCGWAFHDTPIILHEGKFRSDYWGYPDWINMSDIFSSPRDLCFLLTGPGPGQCPWLPGDQYKMHYAQLPDTMGWDVMSSDFIMLADDWLCTESGYVTDIHFWGSWWDSIEYPIEAFVLHIYSDIPAGTGGLPYSRPGDLLWDRFVYPSDFEAIPLHSESWEGWYDPPAWFFEEFDHQKYFQYNVCLDDFWFYQEEGTVYWLGILAGIGTPHWGWKSSQSHWNDNAVWSFYGDPSWLELYEPPNFDQPLDLAFVITNGEPGDCYVNIGEADGSGAIDIDDVVYLIQYIFSGGYAAVPYTTASGDANCSCSVDIDDVVYLINYIFAGGNPPCSCEDWVTACGAIR